MKARFRRIILARKSHTARFPTDSGCACEISGLARCRLGPSALTAFLSGTGFHLRLGCWLGLAALLATMGCASSSPQRAGRAAGPRQPIHPVVMVPRAGLLPERPTDCERVEVRDGSLAFVLFLPAGWLEETNNRRLAVHFHTAEALALSEHLRAGYRFPLVTVFLGSGSARYQEPFRDRERWRRWIKMVEAEEARRGLGRARVETIDVSSFSAGYGAVRELVQQPEAFARIRRIVLSDSLYGGLATGADGKGPRVVQKEHVDAWLPFARAARRGEKTLVLTCSEITPSSYASTGECALAILAALGLKPAPAGGRTTPADGEPTYPLRWRADAGQLHFWGYAGQDPGAHLVHPRHLADVWRALDAAGAFT
jgi:hypothetical protein